MLFLLFLRFACSYNSWKILGHDVYIYRPNLFNATDKDVTKAVVVLHGSEEESQEIFSSGFEPFADFYNFYVAYPEMTVPKSDEWGYDKDIPFFQELAKQLRHNLGVKEIVLCGHSAGGSMTLYLQNELSDFQQAIVISAGVGKLDLWDMSKTGKPTLLIWNINDPVLAYYGGEKLYNQTLTVLRRGDIGESPVKMDLPRSEVVSDAYYLDFEKAPRLRVLRWVSTPGRHAIPRKPLTNFGAAEEAMKFLHWTRN